MTPSGTRFQVIMPFSSDPRRGEKEQAVRHAAHSRGLVPVILGEAATLPHPTFHIGDALADLRLAAFVLADLSLERPSCYYELGLAEALGKDVYVFAQEGTPIHQTASGHRVRFFATDADMIIFIGAILDEAMAHFSAVRQ